MKTRIAIASAILASAAASAAPQLQHFGTTINAGASVYPGNVLFVDCTYTKSPDAHAKVFLVNQAGQVVRTWQTESIRNIAKPVGTDGTIVALRNGGSGATACSQPKGAVTLSTVSTANVATSVYYDANCLLSHDIEVMKDGTYLVMCQSLITNTAITPQPFLDDVIRRVDASGHVLWSWSTADHYSQIGLKKLAQTNIMNGQTYYLTEVPSPAHADVFDTDSIQVIPPNASAASNTAFTAGNILVSQRNTNLLFVIDYNTGNVVWSANDISVGQNNARVIPSGLPGDGHILMLDDGGRAGYPPINRNSSKVTEYDPISATVVWQWGSVSPSRGGFETYERGSAQRLPNGNTFIDESEWGRFVEVDPTGKIVWEHLHLFGNPSQNKGAPDRTIYRAYKVELCWPGCAAQAGVPSGSATSFTW
ncbi:MAG TPA: arylsulfotransferase family protein [Xanthomonadaceae bacterium]|jgi:outer membrane protein assembly factor BamB